MKKLLVILALTVSSNAFAGILLEPYVGYNSGTTTQSGDPDTDVTGIGFGARVGWKMPILFVAVDYSSASLTGKTTGAADVDVDAKNLGVVVGASLPVLRLWAGYTLDAKAKVGTDPEMSGTGMKFGLGYKLPLIPVSFNAEYLMSEYDEDSAGPINPKYENKTIFVSVSAPFEL